jgi:hypothetical protein
LISGFVVLSLVGGLFAALFVALYLVGEGPRWVNYVNRNFSSSAMPDNGQLAAEYTFIASVIAFVVTTISLMGIGYLYVSHNKLPARRKRGQVSF